MSNNITSDRWFLISFYWLNRGVKLNYKGAIYKSNFNK